MLKYAWLKPIGHVPIGVPDGAIHAHVQGPTDGAHVRGPIVGSIDGGGATAIPLCQTADAILETG